MAPKSLKINNIYQVPLTHFQTLKTPSCCKSHTRVIQEDACEVGGRRVAQWVCWEYDALLVIHRTETRSVSAMVGHSHGCEIVTFLDMWLPDEMLAVWFDFSNTKKKKKSNQKFITNMVRIWWLKIISPQSALVWCAHLGTGRTHQGIWTREWHQKSTGAYLLIWLTSNSCPTCAKMYLTLLNNKWFKNCGY